MLTRTNRFLLISVLTGFTFILLFILRASDDNRLTSWEWVFNGVDAASVFLVIFVGSLALIQFSKISLPLRNTAFFLFLCAFVVCVPLWNEPEIVVDASRYFTQAKYLEVYGIGRFVKEWGKDIAAWTDLPLVPFLYGLIFRFAGESRLYIQIFTTLLFSSTVVITYFIGKELWDEDAGFLAGLLLLGSPYLLIQTSLMLADVPTMFFLDLAVFAFIKGLTGKGPGSAVLAGLCIFLALFSKYSTGPMLSILAVIVLIYCRKSYSGIRAQSDPPDSGSSLIEGKPGGPKPVKGLLLRGASMISVAVLLAGAICLYKSEVFVEQIRLLMSYQEPGLKRWGESFVSTFLFQIHPFITVSAVISAWMAFRKRDGRFLIVSWLVILMLVFQIRRIRYVLPLFPMVALMASYGLREVRDREIRRFIVLCILLASLSAVYLAYLPFAQKMSAVNLRDAGAFLNTLEEKDIEVLTFQPREPVLNPAVSVPLLDLYTDRKIIYHYESSIFVPKEDVKTSSLRFTWEYRNPQYYEEKGTSARENPVKVVIAGELDDVFPLYVSMKTRDYQVVRAFIEDEGVFQHKTFVAVYRRLGAPPAE